MITAESILMLGVLLYLFDEISIGTLLCLLFGLWVLR